MYNVEKLEQQWIRYRRKKMIIPAVAAVVGLVVAATFIYFTGFEKNTLESNTTVAMAEDVPSGSHTADKTVVEKKEPAGKLDILATEVPSLAPGTSETRPKAGQIIFQDSREVEKKTKKRKNLLIQVTERGSKDIAVDIENRFEFAKDKSDSLFLAKYYYDKMEYAKAEKWALETNKLDNSIEESWLIFAKALAKQGKRVESLKVLKAYMDQRDSLKAKRLMDKIRRGKSF